MEAVRPRPRFSLAVHIYLWLFLALFAFVPILVTKAVSDREILPVAFWIGASIWPIFAATLFLYAQQRCSGDAMTFRDGLLWVTASMMTGWTYLSFATVFPALLGANCAAVWIALSSDIRRDARYATRKWPLIVKFFYEHRMRQ